MTDEIHLTLSQEVASETFRNLERECGALTNQIQALLQKASEHNLDVVPQLLKWYPDADDVLRLSRVLAALHPLLKALRTATDRKQAVGLVMTNPSWFAGSVGDFSTEVNSFLEVNDG